MSEEGKISPTEIMENAERKAKDFSDLVEKIEGAPEELRLLWTEIYDNALQDRVNAYLMFTDLMRHVMDQPQGHMNYGKLMTSYLERMNKANDQLLKLSELIRDTVIEDDMDPDKLYEEMDRA